MGKSLKQPEGHDTHYLTDGLGYSTGKVDFGCMLLETFSHLFEPQFLFGDYSITCGMFCIAPGTHGV